MTNSDGATPEVKTVDDKECPGSGNGQRYSHKWTWAANPENKVSFTSQCQRCGQFKETKCG